MDMGEANFVSEASPTEIEIPLRGYTEPYVTLTALDWTGAEHPPPIFKASVVHDLVLL